MDERDLTLKFIQAAAKIQQFKEIERVVRDFNNYDPREVKDFLKVSGQCRGEEERKDPELGGADRLF